VGDVAQVSGSPEPASWEDGGGGPASFDHRSSNHSPARPTRVLIADGHRLFADAIRSVFEAEGIDVVGIATTAQDTVDAAKREQPDLVLHGLADDGSEWATTARRIRESSPDTKIIALTELRDPRLAADAMRAGFQGCLTKDIPIAKLFSSIRAALDGQVVLSPRMVRGAFDARPPDVRAAALLADQITPREQDVLSLLVQGASSDEVARSLSVSPNTVRTHVQSIFTKLGVHSRLEATAFAVRYGLVSTKSRTATKDADEPTVVIKLP
jgi:two-component system, NarL family, nitrate/nitrite response regulator NarL